MTTKINHMQQIVKTTLAAGFIVALVACGGGAKDKKAELNDKKAALEKLKEEQKKLEAEIAKLDTGKVEKAKLVSLSTIAADSFTHFIDLQGKIESQNISYIAPRGQGGVVKAVYIKRGDRVHKGQLLLKLDDAIARQNTVAAQQVVNNAASQVSYAQDLYNRQKNLWDQKIGTEVQLVNARNGVTNAENQLKSAEENLKLAKEQLSFTNVVSDVDGEAETVNIRVGEMFSGVQGASAQIVIVNNNNLKATAMVPENYIGKVSVGSKVKLNIPDVHKTFDATVSVAGRAIELTSRSFFIEVKLPAKTDLRPNQVAVVSIQDYATTNTITVPVNTLQNDEKGKFVMTAAKENGKLVARKRPVIAGDFYGDKLEIKSGLKPGDVIVADGYQGLYDGQLLTTNADKVVTNP